MKNLSTKEEILNFIKEQISITNNYIKTLREFEKQIIHISSLPDIPFIKPKIILTEDEFNNIKAKKLIEFNFSSRVLDGLHSVDIVTVNDLLNSNRMNLLAIRNFGLKSLKEISNFIERYNFNEYYNK